MLCNSSHFVHLSQRTAISSTTSSNQMVPTFPNQDAPKEIDLRGLRTADLATLKSTDRFMYVSIPGVRKAVLLNKDIDMSTLQVQTNLQGQVGVEIDEQKEEMNTFKVTRQSRVSVECHPDLMLEELLSSFNDMITEDEASEDDDYCWISDAIGSKMK